MKQLLYKDFKLAINPLYYLVALLSALILIPNWPYFIALMYFFFIVVPNIFATGKASGDISFSVMMPVRKRDVVGSRILSIIIIELLQLIVAGVFAIVNMELYPGGSNLLDPNFAFFGFAFIMFAVFNAIFFPMFYKTAYKVGIPVILAMIVAVVFAVVVEVVVLLVPAVRTVLEAPQYIGVQLGVLAVGVVIFIIANYAAYKASAKRFEKLDL